MLTFLLDALKSLSDSTPNDMPMISSSNPTKFIEDALFCASPFALSYSDPDQKWIIRQHLISLLQDFPSLKPSVALFTHNDGTVLKLLNAAGPLRVSPHAPPVPLTIWVHEFYPHVAPIVYINSDDPDRPVYEDYPFADPSGAATSSYLKNWQFARSDLSGLARNLVKLFSHNHPFHYSDGGSGRAHPSTASKTEAMDRLACSICYDAAAIAAETREEIEDLLAVQFELRRRGESVEIAMSGMEQERRRLKGRTQELWEECDTVLNWLKVYEGGFAIDEAFEALDKGSEMELEWSAADLAAEDLMLELDNAIAEGVVGIDMYMKQVRSLAREQFLRGAMRRKYNCSSSTISSFVL